jgi:hypothetical protein
MNRLNLYVLTTLSIDALQPESPMEVELVPSRLRDALRRRLRPSAAQPR